MEYFFSFRFILGTLLCLFSHERFINNQMSQFYLEENVQNVISAIILKSPKLQTDLLYLRTVFFDASQSLMDQINKLTKKYQKAKQKLKLHSTEHAQSPLPNTDPNLSAQKIKHQTLKSPLNTEKTPNISPNSYDYSPDLMALILTQAKSIKTIFDSVIKGQPQSSKHVQTSKLLNLYTVYKEFYKSFKQKHKKYVQNYSYDEKHIHKNSTTMKHRLLEELKDQTQRRKELEEKLEALKDMMEKSLLHKDKQLQKLNLKLVSLMNQNNLNRPIKVYSCDNCKGPLVVKEEKSQQRSIEKSSKRNQDDDCILGSVSRQKEGQFYKTSNNQRSNPLKISSQEYLQQKSRRSSQFSSSDSSSDDEQKCRSSAQKIKTKKSNIGRFYSGNETIITGKINQTQSEINHHAKAHIHDQKIQKDQILQGHKKNPSNNQQRITFGLQPEGLTGKVEAKELQFIVTKRQSSESPQKVMWDQINSLKEDLIKEKEEKKQLQKKIKDNQAEYKKLESEVDELYKMINDAKENQNKKVENPWTYQNSQTNHYNFGQADSSYTDKNKKKQQSPNQKIKTKASIQQQIRQNKMGDFKDSEDYQEIIRKAERTIHNRSSQSPQQTAKNGLRLNSINDFETISPIKGTERESDEGNITRLLSPIKDFGVMKQEMRNSNKVTEMGVNVGNQDLGFKMAKQAEQLPNQLKQTANFGQVMNTEKEKELMIKAQKLQQMCEAERKQKDGQIKDLMTKAEKQKMRTDELMMMLLLQAFSIEQFVNQKEQEEQNSQNFRNYYAKDFVHK